MKDNGGIQAELRRAYLFSALDEGQLETVLASGQQVRLEAGDSLFHQGQGAERFFWLRSGLMKLARSSAAGDEKVIEIVRPGQTFAEAIMFMDEGGVYPVAAQAIEPSHVLGFDNRAFLGLLRQSPDTCFRVMANMSRRLHDHVNEIDRLTLHSASERLVHFLLQEASGEGCSSVELQVTKHVLASRLSIKPETLSRIFTRLASEGLISVNGNRIVLHDPEALSRFVQT